MFYKQQGRPPYSSNVLKFSLNQRYTSGQDYANLLEEFPLPSISLLRKLTAGGIEPLKALKTRLRDQKISNDSVLIVDEMILQKSSTSDYHGGQMIFLLVFANWLERWELLQIPRCQRYSLSKQTSSALITALRATANLIQDLLHENYSYVLTARFQSDPLERYSKYRQMSGGRFWVHCEKSDYLRRSYK